MKKLIVLLFILLGIIACGGPDGPSDSSDDSGIKELSLNQRSTGTISQVGEVDWYHYRAIDTNNVLQVQCHGDTVTPPLEFLVQVYEQDDNGNYERIWGTHAPEDAVQPADLIMNIPIDHPKDLYITVRDLLDDEASDRIPYYLDLAYIHEPVDNETFTQATEITVDDQVGATDQINDIADVDCFRVSIVSSGVYGFDLGFDFLMDSQVRLDVKVYNDLGDLIYSADSLRIEEYLWRLYLETGDYYIVVEDHGRDDADMSSPYTLCVSSADADEVLVNDSQLTAQTISPSPDVSIEGGTAIEYQQDQDWYAVAIASPPAGSFSTIILTLTDTIPSNLAARFEIVIEGPDGEQILVHEYASSASRYTVQQKVNAGQNLIGIRPVSGTNVQMALEYELTVEVATIEDPAETDGDGNDGIDEADILTPPSDSVEGKIGFRGDADWYTISVNQGTGSQVLNVSFTADDVSDVEYCLDVMMNTGVRIESFSDNNSSGLPAQFNASYFIPESTSGGIQNYFLRVGDCQSDDGNDINYTLEIRVDETPANVVAFPGPNNGGKGTYYFSESIENGLVVGTDKDTAAALEVECAIYPQYDPEFNAENQLLKVAALDTENTYVSDWIAGYIDYRGDQDWFVLDVKSMIPDDATQAPEDWYYDVQIRMYSPGSDVEYAWKLYRDRGSDSTPPNGIVIERTPGVTDSEYIDSDGIMAAWATSLVTGTPGVVDVTVPDSGVDFWIGDEWQDDWYYLSISGFRLCSYFL